MDKTGTKGQTVDIYCAHREDLEKMKIYEGIYFYEGDYYFQNAKLMNLYKGIGSSNYLVIKKQEQIMIDVGFPKGPYVDRQKKEFILDGVSVQDTNLVVFSHAHPDHISAARQLKNYKNIKFAIHRESERFFFNDDYFFESYFKYPQNLRDELMILPEFISKKLFKLLGFGISSLRIDHYFDKFTKDNSQTGIELIELGGHFPGHTGFYFSDTKMLYSADLIYPSRGKYTTMLGINNALASLQKSLNDIDTSLKYDIDVLIPGHGKIILGKDNVKNYLLSGYKNTLSLTHDILSYLRINQYSTISQISKAFFYKQYICNYILSTAVVYSILKYLLEMEYIDFRIKKSKAYWYIPRKNEHYYFTTKILYN